MQILLHVECYVTKILHNGFRKVENSQLDRHWNLDSHWPFCLGLNHKLNNFPIHFRCERRCSFAMLVPVLLTCAMRLEAKTTKTRGTPHFILTWKSDVIHIKSLKIVQRWSHFYIHCVTILMSERTTYCFCSKSMPRNVTLIWQL